jgi:DNA repair protein RecO (recombination protein O)
MAIQRSEALVVGRFALGESDRVVTFFTRRFGKVRGVARSARRLRSRFGAALELFTLGDLVFLDSGRSELVQVDHFDIVRPFEAVRSHLDRLGHAAWMVECVARLTAERDPHASLFALLVRALSAVEIGGRPERIAVVFGLRCMDLVGHRLRTDACVACGRSRAGGAEAVSFDPDGGGTVCPRCARAVGRIVTVHAATLAALERLRALRWAEATALGLGDAERELRALLEAQVSGLIGQSTRSARFLREVARATARSEGSS